jgi:hypothetical protein
MAGIYEKATWKLLIKKDLHCKFLDKKKIRTERQ